MESALDQARERMVAQQLIPRGIRDQGVLQAMRKIPRHRFAPPDLQEEAYADYPLPIGEGQTISQPYIVALMTQSLELKGGEHTLEIGTGSGYQAAILAELSEHLYTVDRIETLLERARVILEDLGYANISYKVSNGTLGWKEHEPYDAIMVTAGAPKIPEPLVAQLAEGGRLVIPVGGRMSQELIKAVKHGSKLETQSLGGCRFVALTGRYGW